MRGLQLGLCVALVIGCDKGKPAASSDRDEPPHDRYALRFSSSSMVARRSSSDGTAPLLKYVRATALGVRPIARPVRRVGLVGELPANPRKDRVDGISAVHVLDSLHQIVGLCSRRKTSVVPVARLRLCIVGGRVPVRKPFKVRGEYHRPLPKLHEREALARDRITKLSCGHAEQGGGGCVRDDRRDDKSRIRAFHAADLPLAR